MPSGNLAFPHKLDTVCAYHLFSAHVFVPFAILLCASDEVCDVIGTEISHDSNVTLVKLRNKKQLSIASAPENFFFVVVW